MLATPVVVMGEVVAAMGEVVVTMGEVVAATVVGGSV